LFAVFYSDLEFEFNTRPSDVTAVAGHETSLTCRPPTSFPVANVTWYKDGALLQLSASARLFPAEVTSSGSLRFVNVQLDDGGQYVCVATNDFASRARRASAPATLTVLGKTEDRAVWIEPFYCSCTRQRIWGRQSVSAQCAACDNRNVI